MAEQKFETSFLSAAGYINSSINDANDAISSISSTINDTIIPKIRTNAFQFKGTITNLSDLTNKITNSNESQLKDVAQGDVYLVKDMNNTLYVLAQQANKKYEWVPFCGEIITTIQELSSLFSLTGQIAEVSGKLGELKEDVVDLGKDVDKLELKVDKNTSDISTINTQIGQISGNIPSGLIGIIEWVRLAYDKKQQLTEDINEVLSAINTTK